MRDCANPAAPAVAAVDLDAEGEAYARVLVSHIRSGAAGPIDLCNVFAFMGDGEMARAFASVLCAALCEQVRPDLEMPRAR